MKHLYKKLILAAFLGASAVDLKAQDPELTQFYASPLYLNPALAGNRICPRISMSYRMQWPGITGTYSSVAASYDQLAQKIKGGIGLVFVNDRAAQGTLNTTGVGLIYAPYIKLGPRASISAALQAGYWQKAVNWSKLHFGDEIDSHKGFIFNTGEAQGLDKAGNFDMAAGLALNSDRFFAGVAVHHIFEPNESFLGGTSILPRKYTAHAGGIIRFDKHSRQPESYISPNILYQVQGDFQQLNLGLYVKKESIVGGLWYRGNDSFIVLLGIEAGSARIGYSYDVTISKLTNATAGAHELSFGWQFTCKPMSKKYRPGMCPSW
ncbi:MAG TPA: type IX secretion system membrane protein PorP/SprF [Bacteroidia bacterium]|nr:type IX secretion system membrane protein PorP/SprF [Bacteroidia bacterium]